MNTIMRLTVFIFFFFSFFAIPAANGCTIISASDGKTIMLGGNEDQMPNNSFLVVDKRGTFGVIYFATPWQEHPLVMLSGINEMGLCYDSNLIPEEELNTHPERKSPPREMYINPLGEIASVEEVLSLLPIYNFGGLYSAQTHFADKSGDAAVIHPGADRELTNLRKPKGIGYLISTNFNLVELDKGSWYCPRYKTADEMLSKMGTKNDLTVEFMASVLKATHQDGMVKTLYSVVYDLKKLNIYLYYNRNFDAPYIIDVKKELAKTTEYRKISLKDFISKRDLKKEKN